MVWAFASATLPALVGAFGATLVALLALRPVARRIGWVDRPGGRKDHAVATPLVGGAAIVLGSAPLAIGLFEFTPAVLSFALAGALILGVGVLDDLVDLAWPFRLGAQAAAGLILVYVGDVRVEMLGPLFGAGAHSLGALSAPFTVLATIGIINAMNMADGVDGLAGSLAACAIAMIVAVALYSGNTRLAGGLVILLGALLAFLLFNLRHPGQARASVFLGGGAEFLGLAIAWSCFRLTQNGFHPVTPALAPFLLAPPVIDCLVLMVRRIRNGRSPFAADRAHLHHLLLEAGLRPTGVVIAVCGASVLFGAVAGLALLVETPVWTLVVAFTLLTMSHYLFTSRREPCVAALARIAAFAGLRGDLRETAEARPADTRAARVTLASAATEGAVSKLAAMAAEVQREPARSGSGRPLEPAGRG